jgi:hypothetical protein
MCENISSVLCSVRWDIILNTTPSQSRSSQWVGVRYHSVWGLLRCRSCEIFHVSNIFWFEFFQQSNALTLRWKHNNVLLRLPSLLFHDIRGWEHSGPRREKEGATLALLVVLSENTPSQLSLSALSTLQRSNQCAPALAQYCSSGRCWLLACLKMFSVLSMSLSPRLTPAPPPRAHSHRTDTTPFEPEDLFLDTQVQVPRSKFQVTQPQTRRRL